MIVVEPHGIGARMNLQQIIRDRGLKQYWVAEQLGILAPRFSYMLRGDIAFPDDKIGELAKMLRITQTEVRRALNGGGA